MFPANFLLNDPVGLLLQLLLVESDKIHYCFLTHSIVGITRIYETIDTNCYASYGGLSTRAKHYNFAASWVLLAVGNGTCEQRESTFAARTRIFLAWTTTRTRHAGVTLLIQLSVTIFLLNL